MFRRCRAITALPVRATCFRGCSGSQKDSGSKTTAAKDADASPLRRLLDESSAFNEADHSEGELHWATQPYAAQRPGSKSRAPPAPVPADTTVILFPGQGTHFVGMGSRFADIPPARQLYDLASNVVGWDMWEVCTRGPAERLEEAAQQCVTVTALAALEAARDQRPAAVERAVAAAGFSLGEFAAMVFAGALSLEGALRVLGVRAAAMRAASADRPGGMLTLWLAPDARLPAALAAARDAARSADPESLEPVCTVASDLHPGCKVIAGDEASLRFLERNGRQYGIKRAARVAGCGPFHSVLMAATREPVAAALAAAGVEKPRLAVWGGVEARPYRDAHHVSKGLAKLAAQPLRWEQTLHGLFARPRDAALPLTLALGPGRALRATLKKVNARAWDVSLQIDV